MEQSTEPQVIAMLRELRQENNPGKESPVLCGKSTALLIPFSNWTRANFYKTLDFNPAVIRIGDIEESRINPPGSILFHSAQSMKRNPTVRNVVVVLGKDHGDNYWLTSVLLSNTWSKLEDEINRLKQKFP
jgi:hypothetical protein